MTSEISREMSRCICRRANPVRRSVPINDRTAVFIGFMALNDRSAEQLVTGSVHKIVRSARMLGNIAVACRRACVGVLGKLASPCWLSSCCHFIHQQCSSPSRQSRDGSRTFQPVVGF